MGARTDSQLNHNLKVKDDRFIVDPHGGDAHGFVFVPQVAWAISRALIT